MYLEVNKVKQSSRSNIINKYGDGQADNQTNEQTDKISGRKVKRKFIKKNTISILLYKKKKFR